MGPGLAECASTGSWLAMQILGPHRLKVGGWNQQSLLLTPGRDSDTCQSARTTGLEDHYFFSPKILQQQCQEHTELLL